MIHRSNKHIFWLNIYQDWAVWAGIRQFGRTENAKFSQFSARRVFDCCLSVLSLKTAKKWNNLWFQRWPRMIQRARWMSSPWLANSTWIRSAFYSSCNWFEFLIRLVDWPPRMFDVKCAFILLLLILPKAQSFLIIQQRFFSKWYLTFFLRYLLSAHRDQRFAAANNDGIMLWQS